MQKPSTQSGFTLIEIIVSLGVFSSVVTIAVGALLVMVAANQRLQSEQSVMTNISFALDSMTREIRTGTAYYCDRAANYSGNNNQFAANDLDDINGLDDYEDCDGPASNGSDAIRGISFVESGDSISGASNDRVLYFFDRGLQTIFRRVGTEDAMPITSAASGAIINDLIFWVDGSFPLEVGGAGSTRQPTVTIFIDASSADNPDKHFYLQTTVTQRTLDL